MYEITNKVPSNGAEAPEGNYFQRMEYTFFIECL